jgi:glutamyl-tRNA synthetase
MEEETSRLAIGLSKEELKSIEPQLTYPDRHLTLRSYIDGYTLSQADSTMWIAIRGNRVAHAFVKKAYQVNLSRWFTFIEQSHPELQQEFATKDNGAKAKRAAKAGLVLATTSPSKMLRWEKLLPDFLPNRRMSPCLIPDT